MVLAVYVLGVGFTNPDYGVSIVAEKDESRATQLDLAICAGDISFHSSNERR
jgi:hypothetical protein